MARRARFATMARMDLREWLQARRGTQHIMPAFVVLAFMKALNDDLHDA